MKELITGPVVVLGKNIDTDQIYPGRYLGLSEPKLIAEHCLEGIEPTLRNKVEIGTILIASTNFGCGSSREHAPISLLHKGVALIVADSFARIFYRNAINLGLPLLICKGLSENLETGQTLQANLCTGKIVLGTREFQAEPLGEHVLNMLFSGGIKPLFRKKYGIHEEGEYISDF